MLRAILIGLLVAPSLSYAAISCGDVTEFNDATPTDPETIAYTTPAGSNQVLFVGTPLRHSTVTIDSVTHAGNAMTAVTTPAFDDPIRSTLYYIANPTPGTNNVVVNMTAAPLADAVIIFTCSGVDTANPIRDSIAQFGNSTAVTGTVVTVLAGDMVVDIMGTDVATTDPTVGADQTVLAAGNDGAELGWGASWQNGPGGTMSWTTTLTQDWSMMAASLRPASTQRHIAPLVIQ